MDKFEKSNSLTSKWFSLLQTFANAQKLYNQITIEIINFKEVSTLKKKERKNKSNI